MTPEPAEARDVGRVDQLEVRDVVARVARAVRLRARPRARRACRGSPRSPIAWTWIWKPSLSSAVARAWKAAGSRFGLPRSSPKPTYGSSTAAVRVSRTPSAKIFDAVRPQAACRGTSTAAPRGAARSATPLSVSHVDRREHARGERAARVEGGVRLEILLRGARLLRATSGRSRWRSRSAFCEAVDVVLRACASAGASRRGPTASSRSVPDRLPRLRIALDAAVAADRASPSSRPRARAPSS